MLEIVESTTDLLEKNLGNQLEAAYLFGSLARGDYVPGLSDVNLLLVLREGTPITAVHEAFSPIWVEHHQILKRAPYVGTKKTVERFLRLDPLFGKHFLRDSRQLSGQDNFIDSELAVVDPHEAYAYMVTEAMQVSAGLAPNLLKEETAANVKMRLLKLAKKLRKEPVPENESTAQSFARIQHFLNPVMARLPATTKWANTVPQGGSSPLLPGLQSVYDELGKTILVFDSLTPQKIIQTDWEKLSTQLPETTKEMQITTVEQMGLSIMFERPLDLRFKKIEHTWGPNFLGAFNPKDKQVKRYSARVPARILINDLPNAYLQSERDEESLNKIVHDFQNKMLNIQLEHELMIRFELSERFTPPTPVPGRDASQQERIDGLFQHLDWWSDFYASQL